jgi:hypothetical protein
VLHVTRLGADVIRKHRAASPGDAFLPALRQREGQRRLRWRRGERPPLLVDSTSLP